MIQLSPSFPIWFPLFVLDSPMDGRHDYGTTQTKEKQKTDGHHGHGTTQTISKRKTKEKWTFSLC